MNEKNIDFYRNKWIRARALTVASVALMGSALSIALAIIFFLSLGQQAAKNREANYERIIAQQDSTIKDYAQVGAFFYDQYKRLANVKLTLVYSGKRGREWVDYYRVWADTQTVGFRLHTNMKFDAEQLDQLEKWLRVAGLPDTFTVRNGFRESRLGLNMAHQRNYDGSRDHGFLGLNDVHIDPDSVFFFEYESRKAVEIYNMRLPSMRAHLCGKKWITYAESQDYLWAMGRNPRDWRDLTIGQNLELGR